MFETPILFLVFNRPDLTGKVFAAIREAKPSKLFIAADGPRQDKTGETELCEQARDVVLKNIDWDCEVFTLLRDNNLGCKIAVSKAITWFFEHVEEGIILEDDILPDQSFFKFCGELLKEYRFDERVMMISGFNYLNTWKSDEKSYFFGYISIWGWATWRRSWKLYDIEMKGWPDYNVQNSLRQSMGNDAMFDYFKGVFEVTYSGAFNTWDLQWVYSILTNSGYAINPSVNLIKNIGFGKDASHTHDINNPVAKLNSNDISFPLIKPAHMMLDVPYLEEVGKKMIPLQGKLSLFEKMRRRIKSILKRS